MLIKPIHYSSYWTTLIRPPQASHDEETESTSVRELMLTEDTIKLQTSNKEAVTGMQNTTVAERRQKAEQLHTTPAKLQQRQIGERLETNEKILCNHLTAPAKTWWMHGTLTSASISFNEAKWLGLDKKHLVKDRHNKTWKDGRRVRRKKSGERNCFWGFPATVLCLLYSLPTATYTEHFKRKPSFFKQTGSPALKKCKTSMKDWNKVLKPELRRTRGNFSMHWLSRRGERAEQSLTLYSPIDSTANQQQFIIRHLALHLKASISLSEK